MPHKPRVIRLRLYVAGHTPKSVAALGNLQRLCATELAGRYRIEVVDLLEQPDRAQRDDIVVVPTLIRRLPPPLRRIIGDLSDRERVLVGLQVNGNGHGGK
jgi:circadian clock protein KaiB